MKEDIDTPVLPDLEIESPVPNFRRKSPERHETRIDNHERSPVNLLRTTSQPISSPKKHRSENDLPTAKDERQKRTATIPSTLLEKGTRTHVKRVIDTDIPNPIPSELGSLVLEIQTGLRRDIERLRLDMFRQFVSFRNEVGQKWEGEVERLRKENDSLRRELDTLKKEQERKSDGMGIWKLR